MGRVRRVLVVNPGRELGGAEHSLLLLLAALRRLGVEPTVALFGDGPFAQALAQLAVPTVVLDVPAALRRASRYTLPTRFAGALRMAAYTGPSVLRLAALARRTRADLLHSNGLKAHVLAGLAGRMLRRPVVWHLRDFPPGGLVGRLFRTAAHRLPALILANSEAVAAAIRSPANPGPPVIALRNPVDLDRFRPDLSPNRVRSELGVSPQVPLVGMIAHLTPWKGHEDFLAIARAVADAVPAARFLVAGGAIYETEGHTGYAEALPRRAAQLGLAERVAFLGARDDVPELLAALDVLVHCPTAPEPFGRVIAEAMAAGRPVVAAASGGVPEIVRDGEDGYLVAPGDIAGFAAAVVRLLGDGGRRAELGRAGRERAAAWFNPARHAAAVVDAYRAIGSA
ncbi:MAG TPA: glycosyltransferase [Gemmatimonadales bacterium]|jgi:glycosyltransferase involved in cell wall biosynthesis|nr:glycosyltransferase [Gemmatimonadales bacterium]